MSKARAVTQPGRQGWRARFESVSPWILGSLSAALMIHGAYGAVTSHLEGRRFMSARLPDQVSLLKPSVDGPYLGHPNSPIFQCLRDGPVGSRALPLSYLADAEGLCRLARQAP